MSPKTKFSSPATRLKEAKFSGWSSTECEICHKALSNAALLYSQAKYGRKLCRQCQSLASYGN
jgi:hypothetical protein